MSKRRVLEIAFVGLKPGIHEFKYEVDDKFFAETENRERSEHHQQVNFTSQQRARD